MTYVVDKSMRRKDELLQEEELVRIVASHWNDAPSLQRTAARLRTTGRQRDAVAVLRRVADLLPGRADVLNELGRAWEVVGESRDAADAYRRAVALEPNSDVVWANLGNALLHAGEISEAEEACRRAASLNASSAHVRNALGCVLLEKGEFAAAAESFEEAVRLWPDFATAHANLGTALLGLGELKRGFAEREWRRKFQHVHQRSGRPWAGEDVFGHTLLIYAEGGLGNIIQFSRFVPVLAKRGARIILECPRRLGPLLRQLPGVWKTSTFGESVAGWDMHCPLASIPAIFGTTLHDLPAEVPYLVAESDRINGWAEKIRSIEGFRVGIAWRAEQQTRYGRLRSIPLSAYAPLAAVSGVSLISLDHEWESDAGFPLVRLEGLDRDGAFLDTAAVMKHLDLVITCDTSIAHLAGALAIPVWIAERSVPDWRWMNDREDSPWYPTVRLFRQRLQGEWAEVFDRMSGELRLRASTETH